MHVSFSSVRGFGTYTPQAFISGRVEYIKYLLNKTFYSSATRNFQKRSFLLRNIPTEGDKLSPVCSYFTHLIQFRTKVTCRVLHRRLLTRHKVNYCVDSQQHSSYIMEHAAVDTATPLEASRPVSAEGTTPTVATETGKRKSEETDVPDTGGRGKRRRGAGGKKLRAGERYIPPPQKRNPGVSFGLEHFNETSYYFEGGLRKVQPYYFDFKTYCKGRWIGKSLLDVFKSEFRAESIEYYQKAAKEGRIRLNETPVEDLSVVLRVSSIIITACHVAQGQ